MKRHWQYLKYLLRHKWFVFVECLKLDVPIWVAIFHDWDKFLPDEWFPYANYFYGKYEFKTLSDIPPALKYMGISFRTQAEVNEAFDFAWLKHQKRNKHHWQWWLLTPDQPRPQFWEQSYDGGQTHSMIANEKGEDVAIVYHEDIKWHKPDYALIKALVADLRNTPVPLEMPDVFRREMLADWRGAGKALGKPDTRSWYCANKDNIVLHPNTRIWIEEQLKV